MIDDDGWCFMMMGIQYISRYQIWSNQEQVRETYVNGSHTPPSDRNRKKRQDPHQRQNKVDILRGPQFALTRYTKITKITKDKQNTIKLLHSAWFNDTWLNYMDPLWLSPWFTSAELQVIEIDMSNIDGKASRLNPSADCTAALEGFSFQPQCMQHSIQFPAVQSTGKKTKHRQDGQSYSLAPCDAMWFQSADFFHAFCFELRH